MKRVMALTIVLLAGCGADGEPIRPQVSTTVGVGSGGVTSSTSVTVERGPVTVGVGF